MNQPIPDVAELEAILAYIRDHPEEWNQSRWYERTDCGTAYCFAGHAIKRAGWLPCWDQGFILCRRPNEINQFVPTLAARLLGLTTTEADRLFRVDNTLECLEHVVKAIANGDYRAPLAMESEQKPTASDVLRHARLLASAALQDERSMAQAIRFAVRQYVTSQEVGGDE